MAPHGRPRHPYRTGDREDGAGGDDPDGGELVRLRRQPVEVGVLHHRERTEAQMPDHHDERERPPQQPEASYGGHDAPRISLRNRARNAGSSSTRSTNRASAASPNSASTPRTAISAVSATTGV